MNTDRLGIHGRSPCDPIVGVHKADYELDSECFGNFVKGRQARGHIAGLEFLAFCRFSHRELHLLAVPIR